MARPVVSLVPVFIALIVIAVVGTGVALYLQLQTDPVSSTIEREEVVRWLVIGHEDGTAFLTVLMVYDPVTNRAAMFDIPGEVGGVLRPIGRVDRIDTLFDEADPRPYVDQVAELAGTPIPSYLLFTRDGLERFIDLVGGLEVFVINDYRRLDAPDPILLPSGNVRLDGPKALQYLLIEDEAEGDLERVGRRQSFVQALLREVQRNSDLLVHPDVIPIRDRLIDGNLETRARNALFAALGTVNPERIVRRRVQGTVRTVEVLGESRDLLFPHFEGQWLRQSVVQVEQTLRADTDEDVATVVISVEILNGTPTAGLARRTSEMMEGYGFVVRRFGNADVSTVERTVVIDRRGLPDLASRVAQIISADNLVTEVLPDSDVDVTVVLGADFDGRIVRGNNE